MEHKDNSSPSRPARVISRPRLRQHSIFKPTGGLVASFVFLRDAEQYAEFLYEYVTYEERSNS